MAMLRMNKKGLLVSELFLSKWYSSFRALKSAEIDKGWYLYEEVLKANDNPKNAFQKDLPSLEKVEMLLKKHQIEAIKEGIASKFEANDLNELLKMGMPMQSAGIAQQKAAICRYCLNMPKPLELGFANKADLMQVISEIAATSTGMGHTCLARKIKDFKNEGLKAFKGKNGLKNAQKITPEVEACIMGIATDKARFERIPYSVDVYDIYRSLHMRDGAFEYKGKRIPYNTLPKITLRTLDLLLKKHKNRLILEERYLSFLNKVKNRPFAHRNKPSFSFGKLSLDDKVMRLNIEGGIQLWAYLAFDVRSGAIVGRAFEFDTKKKGEFVSGKNVSLFKNCLINIFETMQAMGLDAYTPYQIEVEQHLANTAKDTYLREGVLFPRVRFARGGNPQEKNAERMIRNLKYKYEAKIKGFKARPFLKKFENCINQDVKGKIYKKEQALQIANALIDSYNAPLIDKLNADVDSAKLQPINNAAICYWLGKSVETTIRHNQFFEADNHKWLMPKEVDSWFMNLKGTQVTAMIHPITGECQVYQNDRFICNATKIDDSRRVNADADWREGVDSKNLGYFMSQRKSYERIIKEAQHELPKIDELPEAPPLPQPKKRSPFEPTGDDSDYLSAIS